MESVFDKRVQVWKETEAHAQGLREQPPPSLKFKYTKPYGVNNLSLCPAYNVHVVNQDCLEAAKEAQAEGLNPLVLNLSDDWIAGGCVFTGSGAQEESIWRRSNYCQTLLQSLYPLALDECIYSPSVTVFRESEAKGHAWLDPSKTYAVAMVACPGLPHPMCNAARDLTEVDVAKLQKKLDLILTVAAHHGHKCVILGALGCGAWRNPPHHVAKIFKQVLGEWRWGLHKVVVACLETKGDCANPYLKTKSNFGYFKEALST